MVKLSSVQLFFRRPKHNSWHTYEDGIFSLWHSSSLRFQNRYITADSILANDWILQPKGWTPESDNSEPQAIKDLLKIK